MAKKLGTMTIELHGKALPLVVFDDGIAKCEHVVAGEPVFARNGMIDDPKARFGRRQLRWNLCGACVAKYGKMPKN